MHERRMKAMRNIELKVRRPNARQSGETLRAMGARAAGAMSQVDTYFRADAGRLKLREITRDDGRCSAELIWYQRANSTTFRDSNYLLVPVPDPASLKQALAAAYGVRGVVRKQRDVWLYHNVRIHLDEVDVLGGFIEFEAVMSPGESDEVSRARLAELHARLGLRAEDHERGSYSDLLGI